MSKRKFVDTYFENLALKELIEFACKKLRTDVVELGKEYILYMAGLEEKGRVEK